MVAVATSTGCRRSPSAIWSIAPGDYFVDLARSHVDSPLDKLIPTFTTGHFAAFTILQDGTFVAEPGALAGSYRVQDNKLYLTVQSVSGIPLPKPTGFATGKPMTINADRKSFVQSESLGGKPWHITFARNP